MRAALLLSWLCLRVAAAERACVPASTSTLLDLEMCWIGCYAGLYGVPLEFVQAIIDVESGWHPYAVSTKGAAGLMQLTVPTAFTFGVTNRFRIEENIRGGVAYLAYLMRQFGGELRLVAAAYYAGEKRIKRDGLECVDGDVYRYVSQVQHFYRKRQVAASPPVAMHTKGAGSP